VSSPGRDRQLALVDREILEFEPQVRKLVEIPLHRLAGGGQTTEGRLPMRLDEAVFIQEGNVPLRISSIPSRDGFTDNACIVLLHRARLPRHPGSTLPGARDATVE